MKITLLPSTYYSDPTYHRVLSSLKREFSSSGHEVFLFSRRTSGHPGLQLKAEPEAAPCVKSGRGAGEQDFHVPSIAALARVTPPGTILNFHFSGWLRAWHAPLLLAGPLGAARLVVTFQDYRHPDLPPLDAAARKTLLAILRRAYSVTAVSEFLARMIRKDFPSAAGKLRVIPDGTDIPARAAPPAAGREYILTVGREAPYKGLDLLLFAFSRAVEKGCGADLVICGTGGRGPLGRLAGKLGLGRRVVFKGVVPPAGVARLMRGCLFYATTPRWESFGMSALEAMAAGKAVLASKRGGLPEFAAGGRNALLVNPQDTRAVCGAILRLSADSALRKLLGAKAAGTALDYSWTGIAGKYLRRAYGQ